MENLDSIVENMVVNNQIGKIDYKPDEFLNIKKKIINLKTLEQYQGILIIFKNEETILEEGLEEGEKWTQTWLTKYAFQMTDGFKNINIDYNVISSIFTRKINEKLETNYKNTFSILLVKNISGGKKVVIKHTVKELQAIASKNNIKITKKVDGKTVRLNKQGLIAKLKRYKFL